MLIQEYSEPFRYKEYEFSGILTEFDSDAPAGQPGMITRVSRVLIQDEDAEKLPEGAVIIHRPSGVAYEIKAKTRSGIGLTEVDLTKSSSGTFERSF